MKELLFKNKNFTLLMIGKLVSLLGDKIQSFALSLYVLKITGSATQFVSVLALSFIPELIIGPIAGVFTDWFDRKKIVIFTDLINAVLIGVYVGISYFTGGLSITSVYILVVILSITSAIFYPAISSIIPTIVKKEQLVDANSVSSMIMSIGTLVTPAIAGILMDKFGIFIVLVINCLSFFISAIGEIIIDVPKYNKNPSEISLLTFKADFIEGLKYIKNSKVIMTIIVLAATVNFALTPLFEVGIIYIYKNILKISDTHYGIVQTIIATCTLVSPIISSYISKKIDLGKIIFYNTLLISVLSILIAIAIFNPVLNCYSSYIIPSISIAIICGIETILLTIVNILLSSLLQKYIPLEMLGRINTAMYTVVASTIPIGQITFGMLYDVLPTSITVVISGSILFIVINIYKNRLFTLSDSCDKVA